MTSWDWLGLADRRSSRDDIVCARTAVVARHMLRYCGTLSVDVDYLQYQLCHDNRLPSAMTVGIASVGNCKNKIVWLLLC
jgi:hypothetical protein